MRSFVIFLILPVLVLVSLLAFAGEFHTNTEKKFPDAQSSDVSSLTAAAESGDVNAQNALGLMYYLGRNVRRDYAIAFKWFRMAAETGDSYGQAGVGTIFRNEPPNYAQQYFWFSLAARDTKDQVSKNFAVSAATHLTQPEKAAIDKLLIAWVPQKGSATPEVPPIGTPQPDTCTAYKQDAASYRACQDRAEKINRLKQETNQ